VVTPAETRRVVAARALLLRRALMLAQGCSRRVFPEALSVGSEASRLLGEKHGDLFKGVLCEVGYRLRRFPPLNHSFADAEDLRCLTCVIPDTSIVQR
jgi:hypothetical protein